MKTIYPEFEKLEGISPFCDNENEGISINDADYEIISCLTNDLNIDDKIDNFCYILILLRKEKQDNDISKRIKNKSKPLYENRLEYAKYLKLKEANKENYITNIKFDIEKITGYNESTDEYNYKKVGGFKIIDSEVIEAILKILDRKYNSKFSLQNDYKDILDRQKRINSETYQRKHTAKSLKRYLSKNTNLGENKQYYVIGYLFQLTGLETKLSENDYTAFMKTGENKTIYKSYADFLITNIKNKYFKR